MQLIMKKVLLIVFVFLGIILNAQSQCWANDLFIDIANSKNDAFKAFYKNAPVENYDAYKILSKHKELRLDVESLQSVVKIRKNPNYLSSGMSDEILSKINGWGNKGVQVGYKEIVDNIDNFVSALKRNDINCIECDKFFNVFTGSANNSKQGVFYILEDIANDTKTFTGKTINREVRVSKIDDSNGFIDVVVNDKGLTTSNADDLLIEYKWYGGDKTVSQKTFLDEFVKRDLNNIESFNNLQWRIKGQKLTKEKVVEYLSSNEGREMLRNLGVDRVKSFFPKQALQINEGNFVDILINNLKKDEIYSSVFK